MTLLYIDGFAHNAPASRYVTTGTAFQAFGGTTSPRVSGSYYGTLYGSGTQDAKRLITPSAEVFTGIGFRPNAAGLGLVTFWADSAAVGHMTLNLNSSGKLEARRGSYSGTVLATGATTINLDQWRYIEIRCVVHDSTGVFQVRLDGATSYEIDYSGDTRNGGTSTDIDAVSLRSGEQHLVSDWYILNTADVPTDTPCKTWLGDVAVRTLLPSGNGTSSGLTGSDSNQTDNYALVDEVPPSSTDYVGATTGGGLKDTYALPDLPGTVTAVLGAQVNAWMVKTDAGAATAKIVTRVGGTDYVPDTTNVTTSYAEYNKLWTADPADAAWSASTVNGMEIGVQVP